MRYALIAILLIVACGRAHTQTTLANLDDDHITSPNNFNNNLRKWAWNAGPHKGIGCGSGCYASGNLSHTNYYSVDGQSLQMNLIDDGCPNAGCYSNVDFTDRLYLDNNTASGATLLTLDLYATTDQVGIDGSQALEFTIEQDVSSPTPGYTDSYVFTFQCDLKGTGMWRIWCGICNTWEYAYDTNTGQTIPCLPSTQFTPGQFNHYYFHFQRVNTSACAKCTKYLDFTIVYPNGTQEYHQLGCNTSHTMCNSFGVHSYQSTQWEPGLITALQMDGDTYENQYSTWADKWLVAYQ